MRRFIFDIDANIDEMEQIMVENGISVKLNKDNQYVVSEDDFEKVQSIPEVWSYVNELD